ncbi:hypothetical protein M5X06_27995 [Paenibacillus alvei]|uniref:Phage ABA sandwich domain-containing protein n=1 Tax=Paenibacillus alvei TaxID=44250 RepID=A0ABT4GR20_PAEAL|nr:hypothetical protein [Paenibacillus alvei]MCY9758949.1 hypothetical protein [Paenibacillus alvei]MCY9770622.1 hypothetical protein [Paenibacillus alvei]
MTYTREEIKKMPVGRELDGALKEIFEDLSWRGLKFDNPSTDAVDGLEFLNSLRGKYSVNIRNVENYLGVRSWHVSLKNCVYYIDTGEHECVEFGEYTSGSLLEAAVKAAILAMMESGGTGDE